MCTAMCTDKKSIVPKDAEAIVHIEQFFLTFLQKEEMKIKIKIKIYIKKENTYSIGRNQCVLVLMCTNKKTPTVEGGS